MVWKESELVGKQIFEHSNALENYEKVYANFFKELLGKFGEVNIPLPVKMLEVGYSSGEVLGKKKRALEIFVYTPSAHKSPRTGEKGKE